MMEETYSVEIIYADAREIIEQHSHAPLRETEEELASAYSGGT